MTQRRFDEIVIVLPCNPVRGTPQDLQLRWLNKGLLISRSTSKFPNGQDQVLFEATASDFAKLRVPSRRLASAEKWQRALLITVVTYSPFAREMFVSVQPIHVRPDIDLELRGLADAITAVVAGSTKVKEITAGDLANAFPALTEETAVERP